MSISPARLAANRANAARSTGPTTDEGKARSRANAVKHGLRSLVVPVADEATIHARAVGVFETFRPRTEVQAWFCGRVTQTMIQLDHLTIIERQTRDEVAHRAETSWDDDQRREANRIGARLSRNPEGTVDQLQQTAAGCDWLIDQWAQLADQAGRQPWTDEQKTLAHDLRGTRPEFRTNPPTHQVDPYGRAVSPALTEGELAQAHLGVLHEYRLAASDTDEANRLLAAAKLNDFGNRDLGRVRGYGLKLWKILNLSIEYARHETPPALANTPFLRSIPAHFFNPPAESGLIADSRAGEETGAGLSEERAAACPSFPVEPPESMVTPATSPEPEVTPTNEPTDEPGSSERLAIDAISAEKEGQARSQARLSQSPFSRTAHQEETTPTATNEPKLEPITTNEPKLEAASIAANEPKVEAESAPPTRTERPSLTELSRAATALGPELLALIEADLPDPDTLDPDWCREYVAANLGIDPSCLASEPTRTGPTLGKLPASG